MAVSSNNSKSLNVSKSLRRNSAHDSGEESEGENEVIEESPNGRWTKRNEQVGIRVASVCNIDRWVLTSCQSKVSQRDVPGIDQAFLAMDTENGYEVVWNEINISEKRFKSPELDQVPSRRELEPQLRRVYKIYFKLSETSPNIHNSHWCQSSQHRQIPRLLVRREEQ